MKIRQTPFLLTSTLMLLVLSVFCASCLLTAANVPSRITNSGSTSLAAAIMDAGRTTLGAWLYEKADLYFHMGKPRRVDLAFTGTMFQNISEVLGPTEHVHLESDRVVEVVPWLWMASRADPNNIQHYLVASFWLAHEAGQSDLARDLLAEARWNNPFSYPIAMEDALIALKHGDVHDAATQLNAGLAFWEISNNKESEEARQDRARMLLYRALLAEADGDRAAAVTDLEGILELFPGRHGIRLRISELQSGEQPSLLASTIWSDILRADIDKRREHEGCGYDDHEHESEPGCGTPGCTHEHH